MKGCQVVEGLYTENAYGEIELSLSKDEFDSLDEEIKRELKIHFIYDANMDRWISRSVCYKNLAIRSIEKFGFKKGEIEQQQGIEDVKYDHKNFMLLDTKERIRRIKSEWGWIIDNHD